MVAGWELEPLDTGPACLLITIILQQVWFPQRSASCGDALPQTTWETAPLSAPAMALGLRTPASSLSPSRPQACRLRIGKRPNPDM